MRVFIVTGSHVQDALAPPRQLPDEGFVWIACSRAYFSAEQVQVQSSLQALTGHTLLDLHVSDLLNTQLPSGFDLTSHYDLMVFRRLAACDNRPAQAAVARTKLSGPPALRRIDTSPIGFAIFDRVLLTVHPEDCAIREAYAARLMAASSGGPAPASALSANPQALSQSPDERSAGARGIPLNSADMMLRILSQVVDAYLDLRRDLSRQLDHWQTELINPQTRFSNWSALLEARLSLHHLDEICEDQRIAMQDWAESLASWALTGAAQQSREHELLQVRSRDVLEHIDRVVRHVQRLEHGVETAVQMHFNAQSNRTNGIMRTLTSITVIFLPLNLIAAIFGMNFEVIPLLHDRAGFWWILGGMLCIACSLGLVFWRKRYLSQPPR